MEKLGKVNAEALSITGLEGSGWRGLRLSYGASWLFWYFRTAWWRNPEPKQHRRHGISCESPAEGRPPRQRLRSSRVVFIYRPNSPI
jgi:hypothetical protein